MVHQTWWNPSLTVIWNPEALADALGSDWSAVMFNVISEFHD
jgi:hypothetical protein